MNQVAADPPGSKLNLGASFIYLFYWRYSLKAEEKDKDCYLVQVSDLFCWSDLQSEQTSESDVCSRATKLTIPLPLLAKRFQASLNRGQEVLLLPQQAPLESSFIFEAAFLENSLALRAGGSIIK